MLRKLGSIDNYKICTWLGCNQILFYHGDTYASRWHPIESFLRIAIHRNLSKDAFVVYPDSHVWVAPVSLVALGTISFSGGSPVPDCVNSR